MSILLEELEVAIISYLDKDVDNLFEKLLVSKLWYNTIRKITKVSVTNGTFDKFNTVARTFRITSLKLIDIISINFAIFPDLESLKITNNKEFRMISYSTTLGKLTKLDVDSSTFECIPFYYSPITKLYIRGIFHAIHVIDKYDSLTNLTLDDSLITNNERVKFRILKLSIRRLHAFNNKELRINIIRPLYTVSYVKYNQILYTYVNYISRCLKLGDKLEVTKYSVNIEYHCNDKQSIEKYNFSHEIYAEAIFTYANGLCTKKILIKHDGSCKDII